MKFIEQQSQGTLESLLQVAKTYEECGQIYKE